MISHIVQRVDTSTLTIHSEIPGHEAAGGGSIPPEVTIPALKPDITIWDKENKSFNIF